MVFTQAASDNGDYRHEYHSQHVTNTVLYQYQTFDGDFGKNVLPTNVKYSRRRSIEIPAIPLDEINFESKPILPKYYFTDETINSIKQNSVLQLFDLNSTWILLRLTGNKMFSFDVQQNVPFWTGFRKIFSIRVSTPTVIENCRTIPSSPTELNVVFTMIKNVRKMLLNIGQNDPCITVDESIYQLAKQIQWFVPEFEDLTIRLGGFHRTENFLGILGKRMVGSGFSEILQETELFGPSQVEGK